MNCCLCISYAWLQRYGFATDGSADHGDPDSDHFDNYSEWRAGTSPVDASSLLKIVSVSPGTNGVFVTWQSVSGIRYVLERATNLAQPPSFQIAGSDIVSSLTNIVGYLDTGATGSGPFFYRVRVQ